MAPTRRDLSGLPDFPLLPQFNWQRIGILHVNPDQIELRDFCF